MCKGSGEIDITECPLIVIDPEIWELIRYAGLYEKGLPPVAGGVLDQAEAFIRAVEFIFNDEQALKNKLGIF